MISDTTGEAVERGQVWYVKYPLQNELVRVRVTDVSAMTVAVEPLEFHVGEDYRRPARYQHDYLKFIERIGNNGTNTA